MCGHKNAYDCVKAFSETDFTEDLKRFDVPTLIVHGDDDQIVPIGASAMISSKLVKNATLRSIRAVPTAWVTPPRNSSTSTCSRSSKADGRSREGGRMKFELTRWVFALSLLLAPAAATQAALPPAIDERDATVEGTRLHYLTAGQGPAVILLHGYTQTSRMWRPVFPLLSGRFTVIAPDLPGIGDSGIPSGGPDMKTCAIRVHALAKSLGISKARVVGHDIGLMVAPYAYAAQFPAEVEKLVVMDAFLPGVAEWELSKTKLSMPVLVIGGEKTNGEVLGRQMKLVASDVTVVVLKDTGHWVMEERPAETSDALNKFL